MNNWQYDFDDTRSNSQTSLGRKLLSYLFVVLGTIVFICLLTTIAARWSVTAPMVASLLNNDKESKVSQGVTSVVAQTAMPSLQPSPFIQETPLASVTPSANPELAQPLQVTSPNGSVKPDEDFFPPDMPLLRSLMLDAINKDRARARLAPVRWDEMASLAGQLHAEDMLRNDYFSHWDLYGYGPDHRYALIGGTDVVAENIHMFWQRYDNGDPVPFSDWEQIIKNAEESLMNSPGHRKNILTPAHTHVGVGIAYDAEKGEMRLSQEFINHYLEIDPLPHEIHLDDVVVISGRSLLGEKKLLVNLAYQPFPPAPSRSNVRDGAYKNEAEIYSALSLSLHNDAFKLGIPINYKDLPGIYSIRIWINLDSNDEMTQAATIMLWVR